MNEWARDQLREAALKGVRQIKGQFSDGEGGLCAMGVLNRAVNPRSDPWWFEVWGESPPKVVERAALCTDEMACGICGLLQRQEGDLIVHLNDDHELDFLAIANKL